MNDTTNVISVLNDESIDTVLDDLYNVVIGNNIASNTTQVHENEPLEQDQSSNDNEQDDIAQTDTEENDVLRTINDIASKTNIANDGVKENESRFSGAEWFNEVKSLDILMAGIGGIGSFASFMISRLQPNHITMFDNDIVDETNLSGQLFSKKDIERYKCDAANSFISNYSNYLNVSYFNERYSTNAYLMSPVMICGFDNMAARKQFFHDWLAYSQSSNSTEYSKRCLFIDGRLGLEEFQIFAIRGCDINNINEYETKYLFDDSEAESVPCSMKQTTFMAAMIGSVMTNILVNFAADINYNFEERPIPFITEYSARDMRMKIKL